MKKNISILCGAIASFGMLLGLGVSLNQNETKQVNADSATYNLVTDTSSLKAGDIVTFACVEKKTVATAYNTDKNYFDSGTCTIENNVLTGDSVADITLGGTAGDWTLSYDGKLVGSKKTKVMTLDDNTAQNKWTITIDKGVTNVTSKTKDNGTVLYNVGSPRFLNYSSATSATMIAADLFIKNTGPAPEVTSISVKTAPSKVIYEVGDKFNPNGLVITANYSSGNPKDIAYVGNEDKFSFDPSLTTALTATDTSVEIEYAEKTCNQSITVNAPKVLGDVTISGKATANVGGTWDLTGLTVTGTSQDGTSGDMGDITDKCALSSSDSTSTPGVKTITVHVNYKNGEKTFDKSGVNAEVIETDVYTLVEDVDELEDNMEFVLVGIDETNKKDFLMGAYSSGNNVKPIGEITISNKQVTLEDSQAAAIYTIEMDGEDVTLKDVNDLYLYAAGGTGSNHLKAKADVESSGKWNISITDGNATIVCSDEAITRNTIKYNYNSGTPIFSCYTSSSTYGAVQIYAKGGSPVPPPSEDVLQSLTITGAKNSFNEGEAFTLGTSAVIKAKYSLSGEKTLSETDLIYKIGEIDVSIGDPVSADLNNKTVVATYVDDDNQRASAAGYTITVTARTLESIQVSASSTVKKAYVVGEKFNPNGLVLTLKYNVGEDGSASYSETSKANFTFTPNLETSLTKENTSVTIGFGGKTCDLAITVTDTPVPTRTLTEVVIKVNPTKMVYKVGEKFDPTGMMVQAKFSDETTQCPVDYSTDAPDTFTEEKESFPITITVEIDGVTKTATLNVKVSNNAGHLGCGGSVIAASGIVFVSAIAGCIFLAKRKKQD